MRHTNRLPQSFVVKTIAIQPDQSAMVTEFQLDDDGLYRIDIPSLPALDELILVVAANTPVAQQKAGYHLFINSDGR